MMPRIFHDKEFRNELLRLALPVLAQEVLVFLVNTSSAIIIKAILGQDAFNGTTSAGDAFTIFNTILMSFVFAGSVFAAQFAGKKDMQSVRKIFNLSIKISLLLAIIFMVACMIWPVQIISGLTGGEGNVKFGADYLRIFSISFVFYALSMMYYYSVKNAKKTKLIVILSIVIFLLNTILTTTFCYVKIGNNLSIGPAIATVVARGFELALLIILTRKMEETRFSLKYFLHTDADILDKYFKFTIALLASRICWGAGNILVTKVVINHITYPGNPTLTDALITANNTVSTVHNLVGCTNSAITAATSVLIGRELGANKLREANAHSKDIIRLLTVLGIANIALSFVFAPIFMINVSAASKDDFTRFVWMFTGIYAISYFAQAYNATLNDSFFTAGGDRVAMFIANGLFMWGVIVPLSATGYFLHWDPIIIFAICKNEETVKCWANILRYSQKKWVKNIVDLEANKMTNFKYNYDSEKKEVLVTFDYKTINDIKYPVKINDSVTDPIKYTKDYLQQKEANKQLVRFANRYFRNAINQ